MFECGNVSFIYLMSLEYLINHSTMIKFINNITENSYFRINSLQYFFQSYLPFSREQ